MKIKDMPLDLRPQEKLLYEGVEKLSTSELLALIIRTGNKNKSAVQLAEDVMSYSVSTTGSISTIDAKELTSIDGIGVSKACSIVASLELARRVKRSETTAKNIIAIRNSEDVANLLMDELRYEKREHLIAILLNVKGGIEAKCTISIGELASTTVHPREVFNPAIRKGAAAVIVAHNHPSGDPTPSQDDIDATYRLLKASEIIGIKLIDHIIIGNGEYISLRAEGVINGFI